MTTEIQVITKVHYFLRSSHSRENVILTWNSTSNIETATGKTGVYNPEISMREHGSVLSTSPRQKLLRKKCSHDIERFEDFWNFLLFGRSEPVKATGFSRRRAKDKNPLLLQTVGGEASLQFDSVKVDYLIWAKSLILKESNRIYCGSLHRHWCNVLSVFALY